MHTIHDIGTRLQFFDETLDGPLGEALRLAALSVAHEAVHDAEAGVSRRGRLRHQAGVHHHAPETPKSSIQKVLLTA